VIRWRLVWERRRAGHDNVVSNPTPDRNASPAHALNEASSQTLSPRSTIVVPIRIVHGDGLGPSERVLSPSPIAGVEGSPAHHGGAARVNVVVDGLLALRRRRR
jgi:hypothetical protein